MKIRLSLLLLLLTSNLTAQQKNASDSVKYLFGEISKVYGEVTKLTDKDLRSSKAKYENNLKKIRTTSFFISDANNSLTALISAIDDNAYRNKIAEINNPTSNELGFNLELEIQKSLEPIIKKTDIEPSRFKEIVSTVINNPIGSAISSFIPSAGVLSTIFGIVSNIALTNKKVTKQDLVTFQLDIKKFLEKYEKLSKANQDLKTNLENLKVKSDALSKTIKEYLIERALSFNKGLKKEDLDKLPIETIILTYYDPADIDTEISKIVSTVPKIANDLNYDKLLEDNRLSFPFDGGTIAKEITGEIQKHYNEFETIYDDNYNSIKTIVADTSTLSDKNIDKGTITKTLSSVNTLYLQSKQTKPLAARINTLNKRLSAIPVY